MRILLLLLLAFNTLNAFSQYNNDIYIFEENGNKGYIDNHLNVIIKPVYQKLGGFKEKFLGDYSIFKLNGKYGVLDMEGKHIISPKYEYLKNTYNSTLYEYKRNDKAGLITINGKEITKPLYDFIDRFTNKGKSFIARKDGKYGLVKSNGKEISAFKYDYIKGNLDSKIAVIGINKKYGYIDNKGREIIKPTFEFAKSFMDGFAIVKTNNKYGIIDKKGTFKIEPKYQNISYKYSYYNDHQFENHSKIYYIKEHKKIGLIDENFNVIAPPIYDEIGNFNDGFAFVSKDKNYGFINDKGELIIPMIYDNADTFSEGLAPVVKNGKWGYINSKNEVVIDFQFVGCVKPFFDGLAVYRKRNFKSSKAHYVNDQCGYIDLKGNLKIETIYRDASRFRNGVAKVGNNDFEYLINKERKKIVLKSSEVQVIEVEGF